MENTECHSGNIYADILIFANANGKREIKFTKIYADILIFANFRKFMHIFANAKKLAAIRQHWQK